MTFIVGIPILIVSVLVTQACKYYMYPEVSRSICGLICGATAYNGYITASYARKF